MATFAQKVKLRMILICLARLLPMNGDKFLPRRDLTDGPRYRSKIRIG
jgi:hypothetical protein